MPVDAPEIPPYNIKKHVKLERTNEDVFEEVRDKNRGDKSFKIGPIQCIIVLNEPTSYESVAINEYAERNGFRAPIRHINECL